MRQQKYDCVATLQTAGITYQDAESLRRISMTLHRWHELECGDSNEYVSTVITRGHKTIRYGEHANGNGPHHVFLHDENGKPFLECHDNKDGRVAYFSIPDRERGALKRLAAIMARYPTLSYYVQGDPRGAALYILRPGDVPEGSSPDSCYSRGIVVCR